MNSSAPEWKAVPAPLKDREEEHIRGHL
jgi:hypothetical protein